MPQLVRCNGCGAVLYEGEELKPPYLILQEFNGRCPACQRKLSWKPLTLDMKLLKGTTI